MTITIDIALRVLLAVGCGALIGLERQWRARTAGVRTNALVSLGAALFVVMGAFSFLGAGVIMKHGASISGLNTAATLWASAAVGALAGGGLWAVAAGGTVLIMLANTLLRPVGRLLDRRAAGTGLESAEVDYTFEVRCRVDAEPDVRALVFDAVHRPGFTVRSITATDEPDGAVLITAAVHSGERDDRAIEEALAAVVRTEAVTAVRWTAADTPPVD